MRASSPALARVARPAVPRPTPRKREPRPTLRSIDLEIVSDPTAPAQPSSAPPPLPPRARRTRDRVHAPRTSRPEIADAVVTAMRDLTFFETAVEAASFCVVSAMKILPSLAALALLRDPQDHGYVVVYARGPRSSDVVRMRVLESDPLVVAASFAGGSVALEYGQGRSAPARHAAFGDPWSVLVAPVMHDESCVGLLELVDPLDGRTLGESGRQALASIARHLAEFTRERPIVVSNAFAPEQVGLTD